MDATSVIIPPTIAYFTRAPDVRIYTTNRRESGVVRDAMIYEGPRFMNLTP
jgi:hypothetical protein